MQCHGVLYVVPVMQDLVLDARFLSCVVYVCVVCSAMFVYCVMSDSRCLPCVVYAVMLRYNAVVGRHLLRPPYQLGALWDPVDIFDIIIPRQSYPT